MNRAREPLKLKPNLKQLIAPAAVGLILFLLFQVFPWANPDDAEMASPDIISKEQARQAASRFAQEHLQFAAADTDEALVTYQSKSELYGYLAKEKRLSEYNKTYEAKYPYDVYRVRFSEPGGDALNVDVHMQNSGIVGFSYDYARSSFDRIELNKGEIQRQMLLVVEDGMTLAEKQALAEPWLQRAGYDLSNLELVTKEGIPVSNMWTLNPGSGTPGWSTASPSSRGNCALMSPPSRCQPPTLLMSTSRRRMPPC